MSREDAAIPEAVPVHFTEAIQFLRNKIRVPTNRWTDLWRDEHTRGFMVAGAQRDTLIEGFQTAIIKAMEQGTTLEEFRKDFDRIVKKEGWNYNGSRNWRSRIIFETNLRQAYNAGRWEQAQRLKARRPYMRYISVQDERTRHQHRAWHGTILPVDHEWWNTHHPPNGWNCRCSVTTISEREMKRRGWEVTDPPPEIVMTSRRINTSDGPQTIEAPDGIDSGFDYNPGFGAFGRGQHRHILERRGRPAPEFGYTGYRVPTDALPEPLTLPSSLDPLDKIELPTVEQLHAMMLEAVGGEEATFIDPQGNRVHITRAIVEHWAKDPRRVRERARYFNQIPDLLEDPSEIWVGFVREKSGRITLRRRYVRRVRINEDGPTVSVVFVADEFRGYLSGVTFVKGTEKDTAIPTRKFRKGKLIWQKREE